MRSPRRGESILGLTTGEGSPDTTRAGRAVQEGRFPLQWGEQIALCPYQCPLRQLVAEGQPVGLLDLELGAGREKPPIEVERREWGRMVSLAKHPGTG